MGIGKLGWLALLPAVAALPALAAQPTLENIIKPDSATMVSLSPGGDYIAVGTRVEDRVMAAILDRKTMQVVRGLDPEKDGEIAALAWVSPKRVFVVSSHVGSTVKEAFLESAIVAINVDGSDRKNLYASVVSTIRNDDDHILISVCGKGNSKGCWNHVRKVDTKGGYIGQRIADAPMVDANFMADDDGNVRFATSWDKDDNEQLWMLDAGKWTQLNDETKSGVEVLPIGTSRDGTKGYLQSERLDGPDAIERLDFATGKREVVLRDAVQDPAYIVWSVDGAEPIGAAYGTRIPRARFWNESDPDANVLRQLEAAFPDDAVDFGAGSNDGKYAIVHVWSDRDPGSYYLFDRAARKTQLIFRRKPWLDPGDMASTRAIALKARDGLDLHGYYTPPLHAGKDPVPLVVIPHGGPYGTSDEWGFDPEVQLLAQRGYGVLKVNFRGSGGYGRKFGEAGYREWGGKMQADVTDATRWAIQQGLADPSKVCIWGGSYGGYAALMGTIEEPDLYRCAISASAVTDMNLMWKWGDIHRSQYGLSYLKSQVGDDPKHMREMSPVAHAGEIKAALFLVHGVRDDRVSYEHAKAMRDALDQAGKKYESWFPRNETHGIYGDENREEYYERVLKFLDANIGHSG